MPSTDKNSESSLSFQDLIKRATEETNLGNLENAVRLAKLATRKEPNNLNGLNAYVTAKRIEEGDPIVAHIAKLSKIKSLPENQLSLLSFIYAKCLDDLGDFQTAYKYFCRANKFSGKKYDSAGTNGFAQRLMTAVETMPNIQAPPSQQKLVFIIGMPRSGSSILAQSLAGHSKIKSMGEMSALGQAIDPDAEMGKRTGAISPLQFIQNVTTSSLLASQQKYFDLVSDHLDPDKILIDKMPENYWMAWLIPLIFPNALILHAKRTPIATCWSCFRNDFKFGHGYSYDMKDLVSHYKNYQNLMHAFEPRASKNWINVTLEDLSASPKDTLIPILDNLDLRWEEDCLRPDKVIGSVATLSKWQVRQPVKPQMAARWKNYLPFLQEMQTALDKD